MLAPPAVPIRIILHGLNGPVQVHGATYNGVMPAWASQLSDAAIAAILTHERQLGSKSAPPVKAEEVAAIRKQIGARPQPWTVPELQSLPGAPK